MAISSLKVQPLPAGTGLAFAGRLDEHAEAALAAAVPSAGAGGELELDLKGVSHVNSLGIAHWLRFLGRLPRGARLVLTDCSPTFIMAANVVPPMIGRAGVRSVCYGYQCANGHYWWETLALPSGGGPPARPAEVRCAKCARTGRPEYDFDEFFAFAAS